MTALPDAEYCQAERAIGGKCAQLMPCMEHPVRPETEAKWALLKIPLWEEKHAFQPMTVALIFDYADTQGFDQRRCQLVGIPKGLWGTIPEGVTIIEQLGTKNERPKYADGEVLDAWNSRDSPEATKPDFLDIPAPGSLSYELYSRVYRKHSQAAIKAAQDLREALMLLAIIGARPD